MFYNNIFVHYIQENIVKLSLWVSWIEGDIDFVSGPV